MTSILLKAALATVLAVVSGLGLIAISGSIIFADIKAPDARALAQDNAAGATKPMIFTGPEH